MQDPEEKITINNSPVPWNLYDVAFVALLYLLLSFAFGALLKSNIISFNNLWGIFLSHILLSGLPLLTLYYLIEIHYKASFVRTLGLTINRKLSVQYIWGGFYLFLLIFLLSMAITLLWQFVIKTPISNPYSTYGVTKLQAISLIAIFIAPLFEELMFRGFIQPAVCKIIGMFWGVIAVALTFTILHRQYSDNMVATLVLFSLALILGFSRVYFNSVIPAIFAHTLNNFMAAVGLLFGKG